MSTPCHIIVLGAGPAGVGAAYQLTRLRRATATVLERENTVGGLASSFELAGLRVDYGSHRLHPACQPAILADIRSLLGSDLVDRPRHGRIRLRGRWIHFPLKPLDLLRSLPPAFALGASMDLLKKAWPFGRHTGGGDSFASVLEQGLGTTICRDFYFPYARKIWGRPPEELSSTQARRRVQAGSFLKMVRKILSAVPGLKPRGAGRFYYPRQGYGQITQRYYEASRGKGAVYEFGANIQSIEAEPDGHMAVRFQRGETSQRVSGSQVWSTIPLPALIQRLRPEPPSAVFEASNTIRYRSMILIYLVIAQPRFSEYDAHYFPEMDVPITRMSEPRNYSMAIDPTDRTVLCAELPCSRDDDYWSSSDAELGQLVLDALARCGIPVSVRVLEVTTRRLAQAYPIYDRGYEAAFERLDRHVSGLDRVLTLGRQGLFAHDNTHHTLAMAYAAVDCLSDDCSFNRSRWEGYRREFAEHVVVD